MTIAIPKKKLIRWACYIVLGIVALFFIHWAVSATSLGALLTEVLMESKNIVKGLKKEQKKDDQKTEEKLDEISTTDDDNLDTDFNKGK